MQCTLKLLAAMFVALLLSVPQVAFGQSDRDEQAKEGRSTSTAGKTTTAEEITAAVYGTYDHPAFALPGRGVLAIRRTVVAGGVVVGETRGMALVLSSNPLVLVTGTSWLRGEENNELRAEVPGATLRMEMQSYFSLADAAGGMGGMQREYFQNSWQPLPVEIMVRFAEDDEEDDGLTFVFTGIDAALSSAKLAKDAASDGNWLYFAWEGLEADFPTSRKKIEGNQKVAVAFSTSGTIKLICDGESYGRTEIMEQYVSAYKTRQERRSQQPPKSYDKSSADPFANPFANPFSSDAASFNPFGDSVAGNTGPGYPSTRSTEQNQTNATAAASQHEQAIVDAVIAVKMSKDDPARANALEELREVLAAEFDAQRALKAADLAALRQRLEELTQAEQDRAARREEMIQQRLEILIGNL